MGTFICDKCGKMMDLLGVNRHMLVCTRELSLKGTWTDPRAELAQLKLTHPELFREEVTRDGNIPVHETEVEEERLGDDKLPR